MMQFKKILLCVHPEITDLDIVDHAAAIAKRFDARVRVMHTVSDYPEDISEWWNVRNPEQLRDEIVGERQAYLDGIVARLQEFGLTELDTKLRWGTPFLEITREVLEGGHDFVVITALRKSLLAKKMLECPSLDLMRHCPADLWITQGKIGKRFERIGAALGGDGAVVDLKGLNGRIVATAAALAVAEEAELHIVHAVPRYGEGRDEREDMMDLLGERRAQLAAECGNVLTGSGLELPESQIHLPIGGQAAPLVVEIIEKARLNLIVMGTMTRIGVPGLLLGDTAEKVFNHSQTSVVSIKPEGFESLVAKEEAAARRARG